MVTCRCKQFSDWLTQNFSNSGKGYLLSFVMCVYAIDMKIPFSDNTCMPQTICICMLLIAKYFFTITHLLCIVIWSMLVSLEIQHLQVL